MQHLIVQYLSSATLNSETATIAAATTGTILKSGTFKIK